MMIGNIKLLIFLFHVYCSPCISFLLPNPLLRAVDQIKTGIYSYAVSVPIPRFRFPFPNLEKMKQRFSSMDAPSASVEENVLGPSRKLSSDINIDSQLQSLFTINKVDAINKEEVMNISFAKSLGTCFAGRNLAVFLKDLITSRTSFVSGLKVDVFSNSNVDIIRGKVPLLEIKFDSIGYPKVRITGGGKLSVVGVELKMRRLLFQDLHYLRKPYKIYAEFVFNVADIVNSEIIRELLQMLSENLLNTALGDSVKGIYPEVKIQRVTLRSRRLYVSGLAKAAQVKVKSPFDLPNIPFDISAAAEVFEQQIIAVKNIIVVLNPDSPYRTSFPQLLTTPYTIDIGNDFFLEELTLSNENITFRGYSSVLPVDPFSVAPTVSRGLYRYDLTVLLSSLLRFKGGYVYKIPNFDVAVLVSYLDLRSRSLFSFLRQLPAKLGRVRRRLLRRPEVLEVEEVLP